MLPIDCCSKKKVVATPLELIKPDATPKSIPLESSDNPFLIYEKSNPIEGHETIIGTVVHDLFASGVEAAEVMRLRNEYEDIKNINRTDPSHVDEAINTMESLSPEDDEPLAEVPPTNPQQHQVSSETINRNEK